MDLNRRTLLATATAVLAAPALARAQIKAGDGIVGMNARRMVAALRKRELSSREVVAAHLTQIDRLNPRFNAIVSRVDRDVLLKQAAAMDEEAAAGRFLGPLHGLPHAVKDTAPVKGVRSTQGSPILRDNIPAADSLVVPKGSPNKAKAMQFIALATSPKAQAELAPGAWLVSLEFAVPGVLPHAQLRAPGGRVVWIYRLPLRGQSK